MKQELLTYSDRPALTNPRMILGFSGWMDGGEVSTGTVGYLTERLSASKLAEIDPSPFYIYNFPGTMEIAALFRPHVKIEDGVITALDAPHPTFHYDATHDLILFQGKEPNLQWPDFAGCILSVAAEFNVSAIYFVGSVGGLAPHSREPQIYASVSSETMLHTLHDRHLIPSNYEGPGSFITYLTTLARDRGIPMMSLVAEIPPYVNGRNDKCIAAVVRKLATILPIEADFRDQYAAGEEFVRRLNLTLLENPELAEQIRKLEKRFDQESSASKDEELKLWLEKQGFRLD